jgi:hypothetical protein
VDARTQVIETWFRSAANGAAANVIDDATGQPQSTGRRQWGATVGHEDLRVMWFFGSSTPRPEVLPT